MNKLIKYFLISLILTASILSALPVLAIEAPVLQVDIGQSLTPVVNCGSYCEIPWIAQYVQAIYRYGVGLAVILAIVMIMVGGFIWLLSAGSPDKIKTAKDFITSSLTGLVLALFSFVILQTINPNLVNLAPLKIGVPSEIVSSSLVRPGFQVITSNTAFDSTSWFWNNATDGELQQFLAEYNSPPGRDPLTISNQQTQERLGVYISTFDFNATNDLTIFLRNNALEVSRVTSGVTAVARSLLNSISFGYFGSETSDSSDPISYFHSSTNTVYTWNSQANVWSGVIADVNVLQLLYELPKP